AHSENAGVPKPRGLGRYRYAAISVAKLSSKLDHLGSGRGFMPFMWRSLTLCLLAVWLSRPSPAAMQAGVATLDITPKESIWLAGFAARTKPSQGVRQRIFAKALALRDEKGVTAVLVTADLLGFNRELSDSVAR